MMKIVICPDSFKGSLTAIEAAEAIKKGIIEECPASDYIILPLADGGEGTSTIISTIHGGTPQIVETINAVGDKIHATYYISIVNDKKTAVIDIAAASGLSLVPPHKRDIMNATSYGTGILVNDAYDRGCLNFIIGLGGSATCDAGKGILDALGDRLDEISASINVTLLCDVDNPLYGPDGAAYVFAPQKGASTSQTHELDNALRTWHEKIFHDTGRNVAMLPGAGAAGGIGAMFMAYFRTTVTSGIETILDMYDFNDIVSDADLVITGEGRIDAQTLHGKVGMGVLKRCRQCSIPVIALGGSVNDCNLLNDAGFTATLSILSEPTDLRQAMLPMVAKHNLSQTSRQVIRLLKVK